MPRARVCKDCGTPVDGPGTLCAYCKTAVLATCNHDGKRWVMGEFPVAARCLDCGAVLVANGHGWMSEAQMRTLDVRSI